MTKHRSRWVAGILSFICPSGLAQIYNGQLLKALLFFVVYWLVVAVSLFTSIATSPYGLGAVLIMSLLLVIVSLCDALKNSARPIQLKWFNRWYVYVLFYVVVIGLHPQIRARAVVEAFKIPSAAMNPTIIIGDRIIVDKCESVRHDLHRGDLIVFPYPQERNKQFFKRLIGLPGDRIRTEGTDLYINEEKMPHTVVKTENDVTTMSEDLGDHHYTVQYMPYRSFQDQEYVVPEGQLFIMGDNRDNSADSREWGFVPTNDVIGKAAFIYWSADRSRIGQSLVTL